MKTLTVLFAVLAATTVSAQLNPLDYYGYHDLYLMNADGSGVTNLTLGSRQESSPAWSPDGTKILFSGQHGLNDIFVINSDGTGERNLTNTREISERSPAWSPDGNRIVFSAGTLTVTERPNSNITVRSVDISDIYVMDAEGGNKINLTRTPAREGGPVWSPDGTMIAFVSNRSGKNEIYVMDDDGGNQRQITTGGPQGRNSGQPAWSPDGKLIAYTVQEGTNRDIFVIDEDGGGGVQLTSGPGTHEHPAWSPDGSKIVFTSMDLINGDVLRTIYVMNADGSNRVRLGNETRGSDEHPAWSPDGMMLVFQTFRKPLVDNLQHGHLIIHEGGGMQLIPSSGDFPAISYATKDAEGNVTLREITEEEAVEILRQQGDPRFAP